METSTYTPTGSMFFSPELGYDTYSGLSNKIQIVL